VVPRRFAPLLFAALLAGFMTLIVSGVTTALNVGLPSDFGLRWMHAWFPTWAIAFPVLLVVRPLVQRLVERMTS
jgi:hypothetical protein